MQPRLAAASFLLLGVLMVPLGPISAAVAKSAPDRLTIERGGLVGTVEVANEDDLAEFSPWTRGFVDWSKGMLTEAPKGNVYSVSFYLEDRKIFVVEYVPDPTTDAGYVYFPDGKHPAFEINMGTIITGDSDHWNPNGKWHYATDRWNRVIMGALEEGGAVSSPSAAAEKASQDWRFGLLTAYPIASVALLVTVAGGLVLIFRHRPLVR